MHPLPISVPFDVFTKLATDAEPIGKSSQDEKIILSVDRLDYTKGDDDICP